MVLKKTAIGAVIAGTLVFGVRLLQATSGNYMTPGEPGWLPRFGMETAGQTLMVYELILGGGEFVIGIFAVFALGYWASTRIDLRADYKRFAGVLTLGGAVGFVGPIIILAIYGGGWSSLSFGLFSIVSIGYWVTSSIAVGIQFAIVGFAGAAFRTMAHDGLNNGISVDPDTDSSEYSAPESAD